MDPRTIPDLKVSRIRKDLARLDDVPEPILTALRADKRATVRALAESPPTKRRKAPHADLLAHERELWHSGLTLVAGVDEAGRGPLAGPVCAAAAILPVDCELPGVTDSKALTHELREELLPRIEAAAVSIGVEMIDHVEIDRINVFQAAMLAMRRAIAQLDPAPEHVLVDGNHEPGSKLPETAIVKGDALSLSIGAASIVAKVTRDRHMMAADEEYPGYGFAQHKGYATPQHLAALRELGPCDIHRRSYAVVAECEGSRSPAYWHLKDAIGTARSESELTAVGEAIRDQLGSITPEDRDLLKQFYRRQRINLQRRITIHRGDDAPPPEEEELPSDSSRDIET